jgi:hypothetical protein
MRFMAPVAATPAEAWATLTAALGFHDTVAGHRWAAPAGVPTLGGMVEDVGQAPPGALLRLDQPGPGAATLFTVDLGETVMAAFSFYLYRRSGGRERRQRDAALAGVDPGTLPDGSGAEHERLRLTPWVVARTRPRRGHSDAVRLEDVEVVAADPLSAVERTHLGENRVLRCGRAPRAAPVVRVHPPG